MSPPRPILKRTPATLSLESPTRSRRSTEQGVHFPPSPKLTRTHTTHSSSSYDRSPIVVTPNACALPARGCPGKTYVLDDLPVSRGTAGRHLHPRAVNPTHASPSSSNTCELGLGLEGLSTLRKTSSDRDSDPDRTPTAASSHLSQSSQYFPLPPLIPDLSSESDESDGFSSPLPLQASFSSASSSSSSSSCSSTPHNHCIEIPGLPPKLSSAYLGANTSNALSFLPHPPSPPKHDSEDSDKIRRRREKDKIRRDRHRERSRDRGHDREVRERLSQLEIGWDGQGVGHEEGGVEEEDYRSPKYRPFSTPICNLAEKDEGCLAGF
ncbi:hypothetical protein NEOLEDRAFT_1130019 [Neolentinus lepideus HHB14362 ss-1]|uniref:Uncharacterized protein n=1 Tax=Neolentinus lepideus HHB14362 ss-1 TaxID=1314782 RepID=A0A165UFA9_9AGAM|nr:hypothetical protein NEOLEDRAFT_1130019 [Neolentinus lepideus HHB14362 ss-1]